MRIVIMIGTCALLGCASQTQWYQRQTAGHVGCPSQQIKISNADDFEWTATCKGKRYYCSSASNSAGIQALTGDEGSGQVTCSPAQ